MCDGEFFAHSRRVPRPALPGDAPADVERRADRTVVRESAARFSSAARRVGTIVRSRNIDEVMAADARSRRAAALVGVVLVRWPRSSSRSRLAARHRSSPLRTLAETASQHLVTAAITRCAPGSRATTRSARWSIVQRDGRAGRSGANRRLSAACGERAGGQPPQGRVPRDAVARAAHAAERDPRLGSAFCRRRRRGRQTDATGARERSSAMRARRRGSIEDLLDVSRIITGKLRLKCTTVDLGRASSRRPSTSSGRPPTPRAIAARDRARAAVRAGRSATPIACSRSSGTCCRTRSSSRRRAAGSTSTHRRASASALELAVSDTGIGIAPEFLPHVFDRFRQADGSTTRQHGGLGLGLAIVREITLAHNGQVRVESAGTGEGTTFILSLPAFVPAAAPALAAASDDGAGGMPRLDALSVLVIDDDPDAREVARLALGGAGAVIEVAEGAEAAIARAPSGGSTSSSATSQCRDSTAIRCCARSARATCTAASRRRLR